MAENIKRIRTDKGDKPIDYNSLDNLPTTVTDATNTVISPNADYAEVGEWADGNPHGEDRLGYFIAVAEVGDNTIKIRKATADDDVRGVSVYNPAFSGNASLDKYGEDGELLPQYSYVGIMGIIPVIDNGHCAVNGRCMPGANGTAVPSSNNMGYAVLERVDATHVLIAVEPAADMVQRIKADIKAIEEQMANAGTGNLEEAINKALEQAKASGEFDGAPGKTAYEYAKDGGYAGSEADFIREMNYLYGLNGNVQSQLNDKANKSEVADLQTELNGKVPSTRMVNGKALSSDVTLSASDVGADPTGSASTAESNARNYTDGKVAELVNGAPELLDTLGELATAFKDNEDVVKALDESVAKKLPLSGGTMTGPLDFSGGDSNTSGKLILDVAKAGQITNNGTSTIFGFATKNTDALTVGASSYKLKMRGAGDRPTFNGSNMALESDLTAHSGNTSNPHGVTCEQIGALPLSGGALSGTLCAPVYKSDTSTAAIKPSDSNEVNFGSNADYIYFGYENRVGSPGAVRTYYFGCHNGAAGAKSGTIECGTVVENGKALSDKYAPKGDFASHIGNTSNPHGVTAEQTGALPASGGRWTGPISFQDSSLPQKDLQFVCGIDAFALGGQMGWMEKTTFLADCLKWAHAGSDSILPVRLQSFQDHNNPITDPNSATATGFYYVVGGDNRPPFSQSTNVDYRVLTTAYSDQWLQQIATDFRCSDVFVRRCENGVWYPWEKIAKQADVDQKAPAYSYGTEDLTAGVSQLETGKLHFVYE